MIHILFSSYIKNCLQKNKDRTSPIGFSTGTVLCGYKSQCTVMLKLLVKLTELSVLSHKDHRILCFALIIPYDLRIGVILGYSLVSPFMVTLIIVCSITIPSTGLHIYTAARFFGQPCVSQFIFPKRIIVFRPTTYS